MIKGSKSKNLNAKEESKRKLINIALAVFGISIVVFAVVGALVVDNFSNLQQVEELSAMEEDTYKGEIDDRLRFIAMQDDDKAALKEENASEVDGETVEPGDVLTFFNNEEKKNKFEEYNEKFKKKDVNEVEDNNANQPSGVDMEEIPYRKDTPVSPTTTTLKVVIGNFDTKEAAQEELLQISSQFTAPPFIKYVNGKYALQVASFKTQATAYEFVNSLRHQGYNARIIEE
ncbi:MAG: SPOR domain-containing protein [Candidatus Gastranaerophilales bacterium]|nr:SPOR domain-containing protein [Candidatus Gastranaerophilales bacterium]